jgi:hypothetical protein
MVSVQLAGMSASNFFEPLLSTRNSPSEFQKADRQSNEQGAARLFAPLERRVSGLILQP